MDNIRRLIDENRLEEAKDRITLLENGLTEEKAKHTRMRLLGQVRELKKLYVAKSQFSTAEIGSAAELSVPTIAPRFESNERKRHIKGLQGQLLAPLRCIEATVENCTGIDVSDIQCKNSLLLINVKNSKVSCKAQQIRLVGCEDVALQVFTETGIFLQESTRISISPSPRFLELDGNKYRLVYDFTCPFGGENYSLAA